MYILYLPVSYMYIYGIYLYMYMLYLPVLLNYMYEYQTTL